MLALAGGAAAAAFAAQDTAPSGTALPDGDSQSQVAPRFAGADACRSCHEEQFAAWSASTHGTAGGPPGPETVIAPFDGPPIRFADAVIRPETDDRGEYVFVVERPGRPVTRYVVSGVVGGGHMAGGGTQGFVSDFPDGTVRFLPFDYSVDAEAWFCNTAFVGGFWVPGADRAGLRADAGWQPITEAMRLTDCGDWPPVRILGTEKRFANCQNCHGSRVEAEYRPELLRYETRVSALKIDCESCHGPAADHVERAESGLLAASAELGLPALDTLDTDASLAVCFQCHALKRAVSTRLPADAEGRGGSIDYSLGLPVIGDSPYLPDGRIRTFGYQQTHRSSACYLSGPMTCTDCHDPHSQGYRDPFGTALGGRFDDGQCTACHASKLANPEAHTFHPAESTGARCVSCHMPYLQHPELSDAIPYARSDHTIPIPRPGFDESAGLQSACAGCHQDRSAAELALQAAEWWGDLKPHREEVAALFAAEAGGAGSAGRAEALEAVAGLDQRYALAKLMAIDAWVRSPAGGPDSVARATATRSLRHMARDPDLDVAAVAAAALHATLDGDPPESTTARARARWAAALAQWAARAARSGGPADALPFLRRAQEVQPDDPETLTGLAAGLAANLELEEAVRIYQEALRRNPDDPVALVNLGLGLESLGREAEAEALYQRAVEARPVEALAHFNLGNARFRRGDLSGATEAYQTAVDLDPGLARAHYYMAISLVNTGRLQEALPALYNALEFEPGNEEARQILEQVEQALRGLKDG